MSASNNDQTHSVNSQNRVITGFASRRRSRLQSKSTSTPQTYPRFVPSGQQCSSVQTSRFKMLSNSEGRTPSPYNSFKFSDFSRLRAEA
eukprot:3447418-Karenia_brevis.AAC.1